MDVMGPPMRSISCRTRSESVSINGRSARSALVSSVAYRRSTLARSSAWFMSASLRRPRQGGPGRRGVPGKSPARTGAHRDNRPRFTRSARPTASDVEAELHHVAVGHHVVLALDAGLAGGARGGDGAGGDEVVERDDLGLDEALLEVGVDHAGGLRGGPALVDRPGARLLGAGGQVGLQAERVEADAGELVQAGLLLAVVGEHLAGLVGLQLDQLGLELGVEEDRVGGRDERAQLVLHRGVGQAGVVGVEDVDERLGRHELQLVEVLDLSCRSATASGRVSRIA